MQDDSSFDVETLMHQAIVLAEKGRGSVEPNPMVGCLIVKKGRIIGQGYHKQYGGPHAEVNALSNCDESPEGATAIVTLEPCCFQGKTPPCTDALVDAGVSEVIVGMRDPNPKVDGGGIARLNEAGIKTSWGILSRDVAIQNAGFIKSMTTATPWVIAKYAMTMDGNIATTAGDSKWISNESCRKKVHLGRSQIDAIIVGSETVRNDDPLLTARPAKAEAGPRKPVRIVLDSSASISKSSKLVATCKEVPTLVVVDPRKANTKHVNELESLGVEILSLESDYVERVGHLLLELGLREMTNVMVEGGGGVLGEFFQAGCIDEVDLYLAPQLIGAGRSPLRFPELKNIADGKSLEIVDVEQIDGNLFIKAFANRHVFDFK